MAHYIPLIDNGCVPTPYIRFDYIVNDGASTYKMDVYSTHQPFDGKPYAFNFSNCGCYLDLYSK